MALAKRYMMITYSSEEDVEAGVLVEAAAEAKVMAAEAEEGAAEAA